MFSKAYKIASGYTHPVLISFRFYDGTVESGLGSFVVINKEGWIITAAHILDPLIAQQQHAAAIDNYLAAISPVNRNKPQGNIQPDPKWITNVSHWWGADHHRISNFQVLRENDIAIGKIENYNPSFSSHYPVFKDPTMLEHGTSLCKLGYPFYDVKAVFDASANSFRFDPSIFPIPRFPMEGIYTRNISAGRSHDNYDILFLETSSPGLKGQSGGPIFDRDGNIWAIQSQTRHLPLGFSPQVKRGDVMVEENQFLNVGWGAHVSTILKFLDAHAVKYNKG
jgi:hypothetical protein